MTQFLSDAVFRKALKTWRFWNLASASIRKSVLLTQLLRKRTFTRRRIKFAETEIKPEDTLAKMNKREALRLRVGEAIQYGNRVHTAKCDFIRKGIIKLVTSRGGIKVEVLDDADNRTGREEWTAYRLVAYRYQI